MAENNSGSQESLPLSQESYLLLCREFGGSVADVLNIQQMDSEEGYKTMDWGSVVIPNRPVSSLPASESWPGDYFFTVAFTPQIVKKGISWIFSKESNKLYVSKNVPCPVNFSVNTILPEDVYIRAMALFSSSDQASEVVTRCVNHSMDEIKQNLVEAEHLIRCESQSAQYFNDPITDRHSVIVPYENPPVGQMYSSYLYKFMCFNSCAGGPNRRPLMVVFTLERRGVVIGRHKINLKVCACPVRDFKADVKQPADVKERKPVKRPNTGHLLLQNNVPKRIKKDEGEGGYIVRTPDKKCYEFLKRMKKLYNSYSLITSNFPGLQQYIMSSQSSSGEDTDGETPMN